MPEDEKSEVEYNMLKFRNEVIRYKVVDAEAIAAVETVKYPIPELAKFVANKLEKEMNLYYTLKESYELS